MAPSYENEWPGPKTETQKSLTSTNAHSISAADAAVFVLWPTGSQRFSAHSVHGVSQTIELHPLHGRIVRKGSHHRIPRFEKLPRGALGSICHKLKAEGP